MIDKNQQSAASPLVLGIDGGQSSTLVLVASLNGQILGSGLGGPANHIAEPGGLAHLENTLTQSVNAALQSARRIRQDVVSICLGMTGGINEAGEMMRPLFPGSSVESYEDMVTALAGASIGQPGVVVISGTGAVAYGRNANGRAAKTGGWGYIMGDEGSGYSIGRAAMSAATQASDGRGMTTHLQLSIPAHFGLSSLAELRESVYSSKISRPQIAGLAAVVASDATRGDSVSRNLLAAAGRELASAALAVIRRLDALDSGLRVFTTGGVFQAGSLILEPFEQSVRSTSPRSSVQPAAFNNGVGAVLMALQAAGTVLTGDVIRTIRDSMPQLAITKHQKKEA